MSKNVTTSRMTYARLSAEDRGRLAGHIDWADMEAAQAEMLRLNSDVEVTDTDAKTLGWLQEFILGVTTSKEEILVNRPRRTGRMGSLEHFLATLNGSQIDPDTVVYVRDTEGNEIETTVGEGDNRRRIPLAEARAELVKSGVFVRLDNGETFALADGRKVTFEDVNGEDNYMRIVEFSRDGGENYAPVEWKLTLPNRRK